MQTSPPWPAPQPAAPPSSAPAVVPPRRRRWGWALIALGVVLIGATAVIGWRTITGSIERFAAPGSTTIECDEGDHWRIGPRVGSSTSYGPLTVTTSTESSDSAVVSVTGPDGSNVPLATMSASETLTIGGDSYRAALTFRCPADGPTVVSVQTEVPMQVAVFASFGRTMRSVLLLIPLGFAGLAAGIAGVVLLVLSARRPQTA